MTLEPLDKAPEFKIDEYEAEKTTYLVRCKGDVRLGTVAFFLWSKHGRQGAFQAASQLSRQLVNAAMEKVA